MTSKEIKRYRKFQRKYQKELIKLAKDDRCWDWGFMYDILLHMLKGRLEYYNNGDNVWQSEESLKTIRESLAKAVALLEYAGDESNFQFEDQKEYLKKWLDNPTKVETKYGEALSFEGMPEHTSEEYKALWKKEEKAWIDAFKYIGKYIRYWWD